MSSAAAPCLPPPPDAIASQRVRRLLHVGCGARNGRALPACWHGPHWEEIRLDIDPGVEPDIVASICDLSMLADASVDAVYSAHNLEHLDAFEVPRALAEFRRVLRPDGYALITLPDLRAIAVHIAAGQLDAPLYQSAAGAISPLDMLFGHQAALAAGHRHMAHRTGFTAATLGRHLLDAGFAEARVHEGSRWDLWALACMGATDAAVLDQLAAVMQ
ncbi:class I SAM-dependent methyltransferase [Massilia violaceinigra]|uniref:Class I SAM-dependent methyltransferase n=1 Tax=Massilia violaceinigra TaxID=2045208 RepID=A0ABY4A471_9BURK|nr:class I SAM-dependent methyltransferase [Massilia violaceinigra]UOD29586.1 class I SAM-dependent methyltransferase [Massilia violaceinigra]